MRAVLDTNILISALFWRGAPHECLLSAEAGLYELILADEIFDELRKKLVDKFRNSDEEADQIVRNIQGCTELVQLQGLSGWVPDDPDDDKFIETAIVSGADVVVSGDRHLLILKSTEGIDILTAREFLHRLAGALLLNSNGLLSGNGAIMGNVTASIVDGCNVDQHSKPAAMTQILMAVLHNLNSLCKPSGIAQITTTDNQSIDKKCSVVEPM